MLGGARQVIFFAPRYCAEAATLFAAMSVQPEPARKAVINAYIVQLKACGAWAEFDLFYGLAAHDAQAAQLNWKNPGTNTLSPQSTPTFTVDRGYQGDGSTSYLTAGTNFSALVNFQQDDAAIGVWSLTDADHATARDMGPQGSNGIFVSGRLSGSLSGRLNQASTVTGETVANSLGFYGMVRRSSTHESLFKNGVEFASTAKTSAAVPANDIRFLVGNGNFSTRQLALGFVGGALSAAQHAAVYTGGLTYLQKLGAA
jgi:hypothetical protein